MRRNRIRLTESQLHRVIKESVRNVLNEDFSEQATLQDSLGEKLSVITSNDFEELFDGESIINAIPMQYRRNYVNLCQQYKEFVLGITRLTSALRRGYQSY